MRKYLDALSSALSCVESSHRSGFATRKPWGGGPDGKAARRALVVKVAASGEMVVREAAILRVRGELVRVKVASVRVAAMMEG